MVQSLSLSLAKRYNRLRWSILTGFHWAVTGEMRRRVIFMHIPKTAGSSISLFMKSHFGSSRSSKVATIGELHDRCVLPEQIDAARKAQYVGGHFGWETLEKIRGDAFVFTFLRDPVQRLQSRYWAWRGQGTEDFTKRYPTFRAFIDSKDPEICLCTNNAMARQLVTGFADESRWSGTPEELANAAISNLRAIDYVGFTENFESDFVRIAAITGLPVPRIAPRANVSADRLPGKSRASISETDRVLAEKLVSADRILFDYAQKSVVDGRFANVSPSSTPDILRQTTTI